MVKGCGAEITLHVKMEGGPAEIWYNTLRHNTLRHTVVNSLVYHDTCMQLYLFLLNETTIFKW